MANEGIPAFMVGFCGVSDEPPVHFRTAAMPRIAFNDTAGSQDSVAVGQPRRQPLEARVPATLPAVVPWQLAPFQTRQLTNTGKALLPLYLPQHIGHFLADATTFTMPPPMPVALPRNLSAPMPIVRSKALVAACPVPPARAV